MEKEEIKKMSKGLKIAIILIGIVVVFVFAFKLGNNLAKVDDEVLNNDENKDEEVSIGVTYVQDVKLEEVTDIPEIAKLYGEKINAGNDIVMDISDNYGGYYLINKSGVYYLKRNQKEVAKIEKNKFAVYKDQTDKNSKYVSVYCDDESCSFATLASAEYGFISIYSDKCMSIIYNVNTGKYKIYENGIINPVYGNDGIHFTHESTKENDYSVSMISLADYSKVSMPKNVYIVGNGVRLAQGDPYYSASSKYIVVGNSSEIESNKYGLYDYNLNKKIDLIYDDLNTISDDLLVAKKDGKYGIIDADNKTFIEFKYDGIEKIDDYYVVILDNKIGVIDKDGKEIVPLKYEAVDMEFSLRLCCSSENVFSITKKVDQIVISYVDVNRVNEDTRYGYDYSYIILNSDDTYVKVDYLDKVYNFGNEYYYYHFDSFNKISFYDSSGNYYSSIECSDEINDYSVNFIDKSHIEYTCSDEDFNSTEFYYDIKNKKEATLSDIDSTYKDSVYSTDDLYIYLVNGKHEVYNDNYELLMTIEKEDKIECVYDNYYKLTLKDDTVKYYELKGTTWN